MPLIVPEQLPAVELLKKEKIFILANESKDSALLRIGIVNLMPLKIQTETDFLRLLSNSPFRIEVDLISMASHVSKNTPAEHISMFYKQFDAIKDKHYDGLIITGAPVELLPFEEVDFWHELTRVMDWAKEHVSSTLYICWAAFAGLYYNYGIAKHVISPKISGVYPHRVLQPENPLLRGFDDLFHVPHSRFTAIDASDIDRHPELVTLTWGEGVGPHIIMGRDGREIYIVGHSEYAPDALKKEYERDMNKGMSPAAPVNYFKDNDAVRREPVVMWRSHANLLFANWLNYYVSKSIPNG
ncbi:MAG: homoserine O-succinyltransferase [Muribaculaceae bacterium]|nr:homoserine O-succinyltransferase [Muribaculaceae bacterium]